MHHRPSTTRARWLRALSLFACTLLSGLPALAAAGAPVCPVLDAGAPGIEVEGTSTRVMRAANGRLHRVHVWAPEGPAPASGRPVIYVLDGETSFMLVRDVARSLVERYPGTDAPVVVALGYDHPQPYSEEALARTLVERTYDYTPPLPAALLGESFNGQPWPPHGGADEFLDFIQDELKPAIAREFPVDPHRQTLMGHSFGGLFTLHAFFSRPDSFDTYVASSPSLWYGQGYLERAQARFVETFRGNLAGKRLLLTVGGLEQSRVPERGESGNAGWLAGNRMVEGLERMARDLQPLRARGLELQWRVIAGETHLSVKPPAANYGVRFALATPPGREPVAAPVAAVPAAAASPYRLPGSARWNVDGHEVSVVLPVFPASLQPPESGWPLLVQLGNASALGAYADTLRRLEGPGVIDPAVLVSVQRVDRAPDLDATLEALRRKVLPCLSAQLRLDPGRRVLLAHGAHAGPVLAALHRHRLHDYADVVLMEPDADAVSAAAGRAWEPPPVPARVRDQRLLLVVGDAAADDYPGGLQGEAQPWRTPAAARALLARLEPLRSAGLDSGLRELRGEDNRFSSAAMSEALLFTLGRAPSLRRFNPTAAGTP